jgi:hypothetical protein
MPLGVQSSFLDSGSNKASTRGALSGARSPGGAKRELASTFAAGGGSGTGQRPVSMAGVGTWPSLELTHEAHFRILRRCGTRIGQGWLDSPQRTLASKARALSGLSYTHDDDSLEREAGQ